MDGWTIILKSIEVSNYMYSQYVLYTVVQILHSDQLSELLFNIFLPVKNKLSKNVAPQPQSSEFFSGFLNVNVVVMCNIHLQNEMEWRVKAAEDGKEQFNK